MSGASDPSLSTSLCGIPLRNPVLAASGTFAYGIEFEKLVDLNALGGFVVKGLSRELISLYHDSHRGQGDLELLLERFALKL